MTFSEAAMIMMSRGNKVIQPLSVTEYGTYSIDAPDGVDGFNPVNVQLPDRYDEGYQDGYKKGHEDGYSEGYADGESAVKAKIQSKTITENGVYYAADNGLDGFDPINVQVPSSGGYKIPSSMSADEFFKFVGGEAIITDTTTGVSIVYEYTNGNITKLYYVTNGNSRQNLFQVSEGETITNFTIDPATGNYTATVKGMWSTTFANNVPLLIGFGDPTHENIATNS